MTFNNDDRKEHDRPNKRKGFGIVIFPSRSDNERAPSHRINLRNEDGDIVRIGAVWRNESKNGMEYFSGPVETDIDPALFSAVWKAAAQADERRRLKSAGETRQSRENTDDDIPF